MEPAAPGWEHFPHEADIGVRGRGRSKSEAFEQAALAMMHVIADPARVARVKCVDIRCRSADDELLLADWLNALVYEMATRTMLFGDFQVEIDDGELRARACGERVDIARHQPAVEVKGATYTELRVGRDADGLWTAQCVVDV
ncbi:MAG: archease [Gammaproteobacteria bacterium]|nr:archease [Gammaproteobacteria bacterium]